MFWGVDIGQFAARQGARISLLISIHKVAKTMTSARPGTGDSLRNMPGVSGTWYRLRAPLQLIRLALPRFVHLSNWMACELDVSLGLETSKPIAVA